MKKITLIVFLVLTTIALQAQVYDFTGSANPGNWENKASASSATATSDGIVLEFGAGTPRLDITRADMPLDASSFSHVVITLINNNTEIESIGLGHDKNVAGSGVRYTIPANHGGVVSSAVSAGAGLEQTILIQVDNSVEWSNDPGNGTGLDTDNLANMEYLNLRFRNASNTNLTGDSSTNGNIIIKSIEFTNEYAYELLDYDFSNLEVNSDVFNAVNGTISSAPGVAILTPDGATTNPKFDQDFFTVDATNNKYAHIIINSNNSNADRINIVFRAADNSFKTVSPVQTINTGGASTSIDVDISGVAEWTGNIEKWQLLFKESGGGNVSAGAIEISRVAFDNNAILSTDQFEATKFSLYPNPANDVVSVSSNSEIDLVRVFDITGKLVLSSKVINNNGINISNLKTGVYLFNVIMANGNQATKKLIKE